MSLFLRCQWQSPAGQSLDARAAEAIGALTGSALVPKLGGRWFHLGRSRKDALKREVALSATTRYADICRRVPLSDNTAYWSCQLWNGAEDGREANLKLSLFDPPGQPDGVGVEADLAHVRAAVPWPRLLDSVRDLARTLGGCAIVSSHELREEASRLEIAADEHAAYAAFWGVDRSEANPLYRWLAATDRGTPTEIVACDSWDAALAPDAIALGRVAEVLALVADASGGLRP